MGALYRYKKDGYVFEDPLGSIIPWPIARIDEYGNEIPLTMEEIDSWRVNYLKEHSSIEERINKTEINHKSSLFKKILSCLK